MNLKEFEEEYAKLGLNPKTAIVDKFNKRLVKDKANIDKLLSLLKNDDKYHVIMGEAWLISFLARCDIDKTYNYLKNCDLKYNIVGKAIQKICDSYVISNEDKQRFKDLRNKRKFQMEWI